MFDSKTRRRETRNPASRSSFRALAASRTGSLISVSWLLGPVAFMMIEKIAIDRLASAKTLVLAVPEFDRGLPELPAEADFHTTEECREVDQAGIEVLHHAA